MLISDDLASGCGYEKTVLEKAGYQVASLPDTAAPEDYAVPKHRDGHASLIEADSGDLVLAVAKSYYQQKRRHQIDRATEELGIRRVVVDDQDFPPLAFNGIQLADKTIIITAGAPSLEEALKDLVGSNRVYTTDVPIRIIPRKSRGSIRCLTTPLPDSILSQDYNSCVKCLDDLRVSALR